MKKEGGKLRCTCSGDEPGCGKVVGEGRMKAWKKENLKIEMCAVGQGEEHSIRGGRESVSPW